MAKSSKKTKKSTAKKSTAKKTTKKTTKKAKEAAPVLPPEPPQYFLSRKLGALVFVVLFVLALVGYFTSEGTVLQFFSGLFKGLIGWGYWLIAPLFLLIAAILYFIKDKPVGFRIFCACMLPILISAIINLSAMPTAKFAGLAGDYNNILEKLFELGKEMQCGGVVAGGLALALDSAFGLYGAYPILIVLLLFCIFKSMHALIPNELKAQLAENGELYETAEQRAEEQKALAAGKKKNADPAALEPVAVKTKRSYDIPLDISEKPVAPSVKDDAMFTRTASAIPPAVPSSIKRGSPVPVRTIRRESVMPEEYRPAEPVVPEIRPAPAEVPAPTLAVPKEEPAPAPKDKRIQKIDRDTVEAEAQSMEDSIRKAEEAAEEIEYRYPPIDKLRLPLTAAGDARDELLANRDRLESALHSFGINASIVDIIHGPTVTRFDIELEQGVKLSRVTNLAGDLALSLGVINVRIAPIPDKISTVGIEVPNKIVNTVYLREIIESSAFQSAKSKLTFAIGKDIGGNSIVGNISKLPHMLIAGTTGSGKSVCMNSLILSLLYKAAPDEVKMIMIDPKMVELGVYNGIPHLYVPVVTDPKKAAGALQWSVVEMLKRYRLFSEMGVRDLATYNSRCTDKKARLPQVVIVIDELADLMIAASKEVEESICRVAQMGRAAGMHLIIATQRPSADVITGLMKANIPSRIAFAVSSAMESRIILDQAGAEKLVGMGDMLFSPVGSGKPLRIQGAFVSDEEREDVIQFVKEQALPSEASDELKEYMEKALESKNGSEPAAEESASGKAGDYDEMLPQAVEVVLEMKSCSVSMLQRRVKLGYSRAARIVDQMEELGIVGPYEGAKPRALVIDEARWQEMKVELGFAGESELSKAREMAEKAEEDYAG